jgi:hypothetical protein
MILRGAGYTVEAIRRMSPAYRVKALEAINKGQKLKANNLGKVPGQDITQGVVKAGVLGGGLWGVSELAEDANPEVTGDGLLVNPDDYSQNWFFGDQSMFTSGHQEDPRYPSYDAAHAARRPDIDDEEAYAKWISEMRQ